MSEELNMVKLVDVKPDVKPDVESAVKSEEKVSQSPTKEPSPREKRLLALKRELDGISLTKNNLLGVCFKLMQVAETFYDIPGVERKQLVTDFLFDYGREEGIPEIVLEIIPSFIDLAVATVTGKLTLAKVQEEVEKVGKVCCGCF